MRKIKGNILMGALFFSGLTTCTILVFMIGIILMKGIRYLTPAFIFTETSYISNNIGILPNILNTLYIILVTLAFVIPLGVGAAIYITEYAKNKYIVRIITFTTEALMGIPSIIFGLVGMLFFTHIMGLRQGILPGSLTLVMMVLPTIITNTRESLLTVPLAYREGALALGSEKWHMIRTVVLPNALRGILTACILAMGRITGESAALLFTAGFGLKMLSFFHALQSSSATLTVALYIYANEQGKFDIAFAIGVILLIITFILNVSATLLTKKIQVGRMK